MKQKHVIGAMGCIFFVIILAGCIKEDKKNYYSANIAVASYIGKNADGSLTLNSNYQFKISGNSFNVKAGDYGIASFNIIDYSANQPVVNLISWIPIDTSEVYTVRSGKNDVLVDHTDSIDSVFIYSPPYVNTSNYFMINNGLFVKIKSRVSPNSVYDFSWVWYEDSLNTDYSQNKFYIKAKRQSSSSSSLSDNYRILKLDDLIKNRLIIWRDTVLQTADTLSYRFYFYRMYLYFPSGKNASGGNMYKPYSYNPLQLFRKEKR